MSNSTTLSRLDQLLLLRECARNAGFSARTAESAWLESNKGTARERVAAARKAAVAVRDVSIHVAKAEAILAELLSALEAEEGWEEVDKLGTGQDTQDHL